MSCCCWCSPVTIAGKARLTARASAVDVPGYEELIHLAVEHGDKHVLKFTEACLREHALRSRARSSSGRRRAERSFAARSSGAQRVH